MNSGSFILTSILLLISLFSIQFLHGPIKVGRGNSMLIQFFARPPTFWRTKDFSDATCLFNKYQKSLQKNHSVLVAAE